MVGATLRNANLTLADISNAQLADADLCGANLSFASLRYTNISGIRVDGKSTLNTVRIEDLTPAFREYEQTIKIATQDRWLNWADSA